jgi:hypothetical protein
MKDFDLRGAVVEFKTKVHAWPGMTTDMTLKVKHMKQRDLPRFALPEAPAPRPAVKRKPTGECVLFFSSFPIEWHSRLFQLRWGTMVTHRC